MLVDVADYGLSPGGIGPLVFRAVPITGASKAGQDYSQNGLLNPDIPADFSGRTAASQVDITVSDTASFTATEGPVDANEIDTGDIAFLTVTESVGLFNNIDAVDTASLTLSETINIQASGTPDFPVSDTTSLTLTESVVVDVGIDVTDDALLSATEDPGTVDVATDTFDVTDTTSLTITEDAILDIFSGAVDVNVDDIASLQATDVSIVAVGNFGDIARIRFSLKKPGIKFTIH